MSSGPYQVGFPGGRAEKEFFKLLSKAAGKEQKRILEWFDRLAQNPRPVDGKSFKFLKGVIPVHGYLAQYRIREGDWRILYDIDDQNKKVVLLALRRRGHHAYD